MGPIRLASLSLALVAALASPAPADAKKPAPRIAALQPVKKIGVGWKSDRAGWMGFVSFSPDGTMVASDGPATPDDVSGNLTIWSFPQGKLIRRFSDRPESMARDWKHYADPNGIMDQQAGTRILSQPADAIQAFSDDGASVAISSDKYPSGSRIQVFALNGGARTAAFGVHSVFALTISPDGTLLASGGWDMVTLWNLHNGGLRVGALRGFGRYVGALAFGPDGKLLAVGTDAGSLQIWDVHRRKKLRSITVDGGDVSTPAFSPDGRLVAFGVYGTGTVWLADARSGKILSSKKVSDLGCGAVAFSPDGRYLITPSTGGLIAWPWDSGGTVRVFRVVRRGRQRS